MSQLLIEPHYLGSVEYYVLLAQHDEVHFEINDSFPKQTYRNRAYFLTSNKVQPLIIPVKYSNGMPTKDVTIDHSQRWVKDHWGAFYSGYGKAPFFEYFSEDFRTIWDNQIKYLIDLNLKFNEQMFKILQLSASVKLTEDFAHSSSYDFRNMIIPKKPFTDRKIYKPAPYTQLFGDTFVPNLSIVDLIMCEGPNAAQILTNSHRRN
ncbi:WbqC family protein [Ekhidna sp.]|uniref:WbqC family protein n=1 Tax=Ekhidna sp. TaxID=2608089 RepID=UPI00351415E5